MFQQFHIPTAENTVFQQLLPIVSIRYNSAAFAPIRFRARTALGIGGSHASIEAEQYRPAN
jgi:hypothetical protein